MQIGQEITIEKSYKIYSMARKYTMNIKKGDKALVTTRGFKFLTGEARGKLEFSQIEAEDYDNENIARMIFNRLNNVFALEHFMDCEDINSKQMIEEIEDVLSDIL